VRISKEIGEFLSGKDERYAWDLPKVSEGLNEGQRVILEQRGILSTEEIRRLARKTRRAMSVSRGERAACHSDETAESEARSLQATHLDPVTLEPLAGEPAA
jgi:hypothetical protein